MNKDILSVTLTIIMCFFAKAQTSDIQIKILSEAENEPLFGATVYFEELEKGAVTNFDGMATFTEIPDGEHSIIISYLGYETLKTTIQIPTNSDLIFKLKSGGNELDEVVLQSSRSTRTVKKIPTRIEFIGVEELGEKAIMNPTNISMVLRESTGIQMQQTSLSSGSTNIRIQGLDGRYTQLLRDGFPLYGGFSSGLSILQIPPLDLQQFEIIKGSSSTLYGGGAIAGLVNMVSKTPDEEPALDIMLAQTQALGSTANVFYSKRNEKFGVSLYGSGHYQKVYDPEDDGFSNLPKTTSISFNPKFFYYPSEKTTFWFGLNGTYDDRIGGDITKIENGENGIHQYIEENISKRISSQALATLDIMNTPAGGMHPAHIHANTAVEGGGILYTFNIVDGDTGMSMSNLSALDDGTSFGYADLSDVDAYINVHLSMTQLSTIVAQGDIGQNDLTGNTIEYDLGEKDVAGISGTATFAERVNGEALATLNIANTPAGGMHPAHIHANTAAEGGGILYTFTIVDGDTGMSMSNVSTFDDGSAFTYADIDGLDAYINVHLSMTQLSTIVAQGDIGRNDLTGEQTTYTLAEKDVAGISGTATFFERKDGSALAVLDIMNTPAGGMHPAHIHENDAATGGPIAFSFNIVDGDTGMSMTQVEALDNGTAIGYSDILTFDGYINVHLSATQLSTIVAQGNIGSNI